LQLCKQNTAGIDRVWRDRETATCGRYGLGLAIAGFSCASAHVCRTAPTGGCSFILVSDRLASLRSRRLCGVELPVARLDTASPLVRGNGDPDMVRANPLACRGDFLLRLACCQGEDLIAEARRRAFAGDWSCGRGAAAPASARWAARPSRHG